MHQALACERIIISESRPRRARFTIGVLMAASTSAGFVGSLGIPLVPLVASEYAVTLGEAQWSATIALLVGAIATPVLGRLSDGRDPKHLMILALLLTTLGGCLSIPDAGFPLLILGRALQGVGMSLTPLAITAARLVLPPARFSRAVGYLSVSAVSGAGAAFPVMTWIASSVNLHASFAVGAGLSALTLLAVIIAIPSAPADTAPATRVDYLGAALLTVSVSSILLAITQARTSPWFAAASLASSVGCGATLALWTRRHASPFVDLATHLRPPLRGVNVATLLIGVGSYGGLALASLRTQAPLSTDYGSGGTAFLAGCMIIPFAIMNVVGGRIAPAVRARVGGLRTLALGALLTTAGVSALGLSFRSLVVLGVIMCIVGLGAGLSFASSPAIIGDLVEPRLMGSALSFNMLLRYFGFAAGGALAIAVLELISPIGSLHPDAAALLWAALACALAPALVTPQLIRRGHGT